MTQLMSATAERRSLDRDQAGIELRADDTGAERFHGLALVYGVRAKIGNPRTWGWFEQFDAGAAADSLKEFDQRMLIDHDTYYLVSRVSAGDLTLTDTARGVEVDSGLDDELSYIRDFKVNVRKRRLTGMSVGFFVKPAGARWEEIEVEETRPDGKIEIYTADLRRISAIELWEASGVTFPAYTDTEAQLRSALVALSGCENRDVLVRRADKRPEFRQLLELRDRFGEAPMSVDELRALENRPPEPEATGGPYSPDSLDRRMRALQTRYRIR